MHKHFVNQMVYVRSLSCNTDYTSISQLKINVNAWDQVVLCSRARRSCLRRVTVSKIQLKKQKQKNIKIKRTKIIATIKNIGWAVTPGAPSKGRIVSYFTSGH